MENNNWIQHMEFAVLMLTLIGTMYMIDGKIERQGARTDKLYKMFIEIVKGK